MADDASGVHAVATVKNKVSGNYALKKRLPRRPPKRKNELYATKKSPLKAQLSRCEELFRDGEKEIVIHGLGAAVVVAINLALMLRDLLHHTVDLDVRTDTVDIIDDLEPQDDETEPATNRRQNSAIHIRVFRVALEKLYV